MYDHCAYGQDIQHSVGGAVDQVEDLAEVEGPVSQCTQGPRPSTDFPLADALPDLMVKSVDHPQALGLRVVVVGASWEC